MSDLVERVARAMYDTSSDIWGDYSETWEAADDKHIYLIEARAAIAEVRAFDVERGPSDAEVEVAARVMYRRMEEQAFASGAVPFFTEWKDANPEIHRHYRAIVSDFIKAAAKVRQEEAE